MRRLLLVLGVLAGLLPTPAEAVFPFAPPETVIAEIASMFSFEDPMVSSTHQAHYACDARAAKEAKFTHVRCELTDSSGGNAQVEELRLPGWFSAVTSQVGGIVRPAQLCATAWAIYEVDGEEFVTTDGPDCVAV